MESLVHFVHVLFAAIWVGGNLALQVVATRAWSSKNRSRMPELAGDFEFVGKAIFTPASLLVLISGIALVLTSNGEFSFGQFWIYSSLTAFAFSFGAGLLYLTPKLREAKAVWDAEGPASERGAQLMHTLFIVSRIEFVLLFLIVFAMVAKPFS